MKIRTCFSITLLLIGATSLPAADWPQWRGPDRTDVSKETGLLKKWPDEGPKRVWFYKEAGLGYSGPSIVGGKLFTMGTRENEEVLFALNADTGKELWVAKLGKILENAWGNGPRGTPTVDGERVFTLSGEGNLVCAQVSDGKIVWTTAMKDVGGKLPGWGYTESVVVDGEQVVCTPGGDQGTIAAFNKSDGKLRWQSKDIKDKAQYSSIIPATINGEKQYVQLTTESVFAVSPKDGALLWRVDFPGKTAVIPTPIVKDNFIFVTAGYGAGCKLIEIKPGNEATEVYANKVMKNHHAGFSLGNVLITAQAGGELRAGFNLPDDFGTDPIGPGAATPTPVTGSRGAERARTFDLGFYLFTRAEGRAVAHNIFLDGNTFGNSASVDRKWFVADLSVGASVNYRNTKLTYALVYRTKEFYGQDEAQVFGSVSVNFAF